LSRILPVRSETTAVVAQATLRLCSEPECERVIRLAHDRGVASATANRGPQEGGAPIFVVLLDEPDELARFLPELRETVAGAPISVIRESVEHGLEHAAGEEIRRRARKGVHCGFHHVLDAHVGDADAVAGEQNRAASNVSGSLLLGLLALLFGLYLGTPAG
jgi:hypothetical protein